MKFILSIQRPTESTFSIALLPNPIRPDKTRLDADYTFLSRVEGEPDKEGMMLLEFIKRSFMPMILELFSDLVTIKEEQVKYDGEIWNALHITFRDKDWREKLEHKIEA